MEATVPYVEVVLDVRLKSQFNPEHKLWLRMKIDEVTQQLVIVEDIDGQLVRLLRKLDMLEPSPEQDDAEESITEVLRRVKVEHSAPVALEVNVVMWLTIPEYDDHIVFDGDIDAIRVTVQALRRPRSAISA